MEQYLIYLRKSRKDRELELQTGDYDTLKRHRNDLMALAKANIGNATSPSSGLGGVSTCMSGSMAKPFSAARAFTSQATKSFH